MTSHNPARAEAGTALAGDVEALDFVSGRPVLGVDIGGTDIKLGLFDGDGTALELGSQPTALGSGEALVAQLAAAVEGARMRHPLAAPAAIGMHAPGLVDDQHGVLLLAENLGLADVPLRPLLEEATGLPVAFGNDARGAGYAEFLMGAARGYHNAVVVSIGTGIGAAVFVDGRSYDADGYGCELGHMRMVTRGSHHGVRCACGGFGCLETFASAGGIARAYTRATGRQVTGSRQVFEAAAAGDPAAVRVRDEGIDMLGLAFAQLATTLAPEAIVVAGGITRAGDAFFAPLRQAMDDMLTFHRRPQVVRARFGDRAGVIGSALRADRLLHA